MQFDDSSVARFYRSASACYRDEAFRYMLRYFPRLTESADFNKHIDLETLCRLISSPAVQAYPQQRLDGILAWARYDQICRREYLHRLLAHLPGPLIDENILKSLLSDCMVRSSVRASDTITDLISASSRPYHESGTTHALGLTSLRSDGGEKVFGFVSGGNKVEFEVTVTASPCMTHVKFSLRCKRVAVDEKHRLPECVRINVRVELCAENSKSANMIAVHGGTVEEDSAVVISGGCKSPFTRRFHVDACQMRQYVANGSRVSLFVYLNALDVNGRVFRFSSTPACHESAHQQAATTCTCHHHSCDAALQSHHCATKVSHCNHSCAERGQAGEAGYRRRSHCCHKKRHSCQCRRVHCRWAC